MMILITHISLAVISIALSTYLYFRASSRLLVTTYALTASTLATGFYLTASQPAHIASACITGLFYVGIVSFGIVSAHRRLAAEKTKS